MQFDIPHHVFEEGNHSHHPTCGVSEESQTVCGSLSLVSYVAHNKVCTFNTVAMSVRDAWDLTFWMDVARKHAPPYEFHGCFYHGCPKCFPAGTPNPVSVLTMARTVRKDASKNDVLETTRLASGGNVGNASFAIFFNGTREAKGVRGRFEGYCRPFESARRVLRGRVNAVKLLVKTEANPTTKIKYVDFTSLYPGHQQERCVPCRSPTIFTENIHPDITRYFGLIQCDVVGTQRSVSSRVTL